MAQVKARGTPLIERGDIHFLYRPRVAIDEVHGFKDVERFYILLRPWGTQLYRADHHRPLKALKLPCEVVREPLFQGERA